MKRITNPIFNFISVVMIQLTSENCDNPKGITPINPKVNTHLITVIGWITHQGFNCN